VVLFGEMLPEAAIDRLYAVLGQGIDLVLSIGTTSVFPYIAGPVEQAARLGAATVEINPGDTEVSHLVRYRLRERAAVALPEILRRL
jgi:NAD-dependent deacetylase